MSNATPHSKMAARVHRKGFKPLPSDGWSPEWGTWEDYVERCVREGAQVKNDLIGELIIWYVNGQRHREDGPAIEYNIGFKEWWYNGRPHRLDGPAIERPNGWVEFWKDGIQYTDITFTQRFDDE